MPVKKDEVIIKEKEKERFNVIVESRDTCNIYYYSLTQDQINLLEEFRDYGLTNINYTVLDKITTWEEI